MITRYYLSSPQPLGPEPEPFKYEVPLPAWLLAERSAGFRHKGDRDDQPATGGFSGTGIKGSQNTRWTTVKVRGMMRCGNCLVDITLINEQYYDYQPDAEGIWHTELAVKDQWRHVNHEFPLELGPIECNLPAVYFEATPQET